MAHGKITPLGDLAAGSADWPEAVASLAESCVSPSAISRPSFDEIVAALKERGIDSLFPIQKAVFEPAMAGRDIIGVAETGSGKTLAFFLPALMHLASAPAAKGGAAAGKYWGVGRVPRTRSV